MKEIFMNGAQPGSKGVAAKSGYMNSDLFTNGYLPFFVQQSRCIPESPVLLILDNHSSHISLTAVDYCKSSGIVLLTLPPHTSHKLQPLDRCLYGPLKRHFSKGMDDWMRTNPGRAVTIYEVGKLAGTAFNLTMTPNKISSGFRVTGIFPLNSQIFEDHEFAPAEVTDRPLTEQDEENVEPIQLPQTPVAAEPDEASTSHVTPAEILPLPKAGPRKKSTRRKVSSAILTDIPEKNRLEDSERESKKKRPVAKRLPKKKLVATNEDSTSEEELAHNLLDSDTDSPDDQSVHYQEPTADSVKVNSYVLVKYSTKRKTKIHYVGVVLKVDGENYEVNFMRKVKGSAACFMYPDMEDRDDCVKLTDIVLLLGNPTTVGGTVRAVKKVTFDVELTDYNIQ